MKRVIVISTSLRRGSNSDMQADRFVEGAKAAAMGTLYVYEGFGTTLNATGGSQGTTAGTGGAGGQNRYFSHSQGVYDEHFTVGGGGAGGYGGGSSTQSARVKSNTVDWDDDWSE